MIFSSMSCDSLYILNLLFSKAYPSAGYRSKWYMDVYMSSCLDLKRLHDQYTGAGKCCCPIHGMYLLFKSLIFLRFWVISGTEIFRKLYGKNTEILQKMCRKKNFYIQKEYRSHAEEIQNKCRNFTKTANLLSNLVDEIAAQFMIFILCFAYKQSIRSKGWIYKGF